VFLAIVFGVFIIATSCALFAIVLGVFVIATSIGIALCVATGALVFVLFESLLMQLEESVFSFESTSAGIDFSVSIVSLLEQGATGLRKIGAWVLVGWAPTWVNPGWWTTAARFSGETTKRGKIGSHASSETSGGIDGHLSSVSVLSTSAGGGTDLPSSGSGTVGLISRSGASGSNAGIVGALISTDFAHNGVSLFVAQTGALGYAVVEK